MMYRTNVLLRPASRIVRAGPIVPRVVPTLPRVMRAGPLSRAAGSRIVRAGPSSCGCKSRGLRERVETETPEDVDPIPVRGAAGKCRPFLKIEKDAEKFAACNALAEEIGSLDEPKKAFLIIEDAIGDEVNEVFGIMLLDIHKRFMGLAETGRGEPSSVMAPMKPTLQMAIAGGADSIILWHVHPSGVEAEPSDADNETTEAFADACETVELPLLDHIIVGGDVKNRSYYSYLENNAL